MAEPTSASRRTWARYWARPRHRIAVGLLVLFMGAALLADALASDLPLYLELDGTRFVLPCLTHPLPLRGLDNAALQKLPANRVGALWLPPIPFGPARTDVTAALAPPSSTHWLGTDSVGRDVLARVVHGARVSLAVGLLSTALATLIGLLLGALAGYGGGVTDVLLARSMEVVQTFPALFLLLGLLALVPSAGIVTLIAVLGLTRWVEMGRLARAETLRVRTLDYVLAARALGSPPWRTFAIHVLPAAAGPVLIASSLLVGSMVLLESSLAFLGLGAPPPTASWGELLSQARGAPAAWWLTLGPGTCIFLVVVGCNVLGEGLREALGGRSGAPAGTLPPRKL
ncbi:MAG: ABC transporter permease [Deltaproteobacteria bacterium]|nr:ABC transporter permease [Deltaproteobacteria bacterium]